MGDDLLTEGKLHIGVPTMVCLLKQSDSVRDINWQLRRVGIFIKVISLYIIKDLSAEFVILPLFVRVKFMAEYDTHGWNIGAAMRFWKHLSVNVFTREFTCVSAGLRYECTLIH